MFAELIQFSFGVFGLALIIVTLLVIQQIEDAGVASTVDRSALTFVKVGNWIYVGLLGLALLFGITAAVIAVKN